MASKGDRKKAERLIYMMYDLMDVTRTNSSYYKEVFAKMSDAQFMALFKKKFPLRFHQKPWEVEPTMSDLEKTCDFLGIPVLEEVRQPHLYVNGDGKAVKTKEALVGYLHLRRVQQFLTKKNSMSADINKRDMKTGLLIGYDKNGKTSDREAEALLAIGLEKTAEEFTGPKADMMEAKSTMYSLINTLGMVSLKDLEIKGEDSLALNLINVYMIGAHLHTNLLNKDYQLPYTIKKGKK